MVELPRVGDCRKGWRPSIHRRRVFAVEFFVTAPHEKPRNRKWLFVVARFANDMVSVLFDIDRNPRHIRGINLLGVALFARINAVNEPRFLMFQLLVFELFSQPFRQIFLPEFLRGLPCRK